MSPAASAPSGSRNRSWTDDTAARAARALAAGGAYFLAIAAASWLFGTLRQAALQRGLPGDWTTLVEAPVLLSLAALAAVGSIRAFGVRDRAGDRLVVGSLAVTLMIAAELIGGPLVQDWGLYETLSGLQPEPVALVFGVLLGALLAPLLEPLGRRARPDREAPSP